MHRELIGLNEPERQSGLDKVDRPNEHSGLDKAGRLSGLEMPRQIMWVQ